MKSCDFGKYECRAHLVEQATLYFHRSSIAGMAGLSHFGICTVTHSFLSVDVFSQTIPRGATNTGPASATLALWKQLENWAAWI
jgi:hypothetical protein